MDEEADKLYTWETEYEKTWEAIQEDAEGHLQSTADDEAYKAKRRRLFERPSNVRLGMMRHMFLVLDCSRAMEDKDLKPDRMVCSVKVMEKFVNEFFDQNPISQLGIIVTKNGKADKLMELNGNPRLHVKALQGLVSCGGEPSLQNALEMAMRALRHVPAHASKEVVVVMGALTSQDPGNISSTIDDLCKQSVRCSIVGLAAEVRLCKTICQKTQGSYGVILSETHFRDMMLQHCRPPLATANTDASLIKMGFPKHHMSGPLVACLCHLDTRSAEYITCTGYFCPQCHSKYCELPVECRVCGLTLVLAPHLARSYHHLFPLPTFVETQLLHRCTCTGCLAFVDEKAYMCPKCRQLFCIDCDLYVHETLHNCPGCTSSATASASHTAT